MLNVKGREYMVVCVAVYHTTCTYNLESNIEMEVDKAEQNSNTETNVWWFLVGTLKWK